MLVGTRKRFRSGYKDPPTWLNVRVTIPKLYQTRMVLSTTPNYGLHWHNSPSPSKFSVNPILPKWEYSPNYVRVYSLTQDWEYRDVINGSLLRQYFAPVRSTKQRKRVRVRVYVRWYTTVGVIILHRTPRVIYVGWMEPERSEVLTLFIWIKKNFI